MATRQNFLDALMEDSKLAKPDSVLARLMNPLQELARAVRNPVQLIPKAADFVKYVKDNFDEEMQGAIAGILQRLVDEGEVTGGIWMMMIHNLRRSTNRDDLTRDARHAGLRILYFNDGNTRKYELYMPILIMVYREREERKKDGSLVWDEKRGCNKWEKVLVLPEDMVAKKETEADLFRKGKKIPVWKPFLPVGKDRWEARENAYANALPDTAKVPDTRIELMLDDARRIGANTTCVFYMLWSELIRIAPTLNLEKRWEEGLPDQVLNHTATMAELVDKIVPDTGPGLGFVGEHNLPFKYVGMSMTSIMRSGGSKPYIPEKEQLCDPNHFSFIFTSARTYEFRGASFPDGRRTCYLLQMSAAVTGERPAVWLLVSPLINPNTGTWRWMTIDPRRGVLRLCLEFIWCMGWGDPGAQRDFNALVAFKRDAINGMRDIASQIDDWKIESAADRPGVKAEEWKKDADAGYDQTANRKNWCHRGFWLERLVALYDRISERREEEFRSMAANDTLTITNVDLEWNNGFLWRHLLEEARRAKFLPIYRLAYEVMERIDVAPAFGSETFYRTAASKLIGEGLYLHLPEPEKSQKKGRLQVMADYCQFVAWAKGCVLNNARDTHGHEMLKLGVGYYPPGFMNLELVDRFHEIITRFYEHDKVAVDQVLKQIARRLTVSHTGGLGVTEKERSDIHQIILSAISKGCGVEGLVEELGRLGVELVIDPNAEKKMIAVEFAWRCGRLIELVELEEIWRMCGIDVEKEHVSLTAMLRRLIKANDSGILKKMRDQDAEGGVEEGSWKAQLFYTAVTSWFEENKSNIVAEARKGMTQ